MRRKILKLSAGWVLCAAAWGACDAEKAHTRKDLGFQVTFPDTFDVEGYTEGVCGHPDKRNPSPFYAHVYVEEVKEGESLWSFFTTPYWQAMLKSRTLTAINLVKLDGRSAIKLSTSEGKRRSVMYHTVANARGYVIWFHAPEADFDKHAKDIDAIVKSFKIIEAK